MSNRKAGDTFPRCPNCDADGVCLYVGPCAVCYGNRARANEARAKGSPSYIAGKTEQLMGTAIEGVLIDVMKYIDLYRSRFDSNVGDDTVLGPHVQSILGGVLGLLNGPTGKLDCGYTDKRIRALATQAGLDPEVL